MASISHESETLLAKIRDGSLAFTEAAADLFLRSADILRGLLLSIRSVGGGGAEIVPGGLDRLVTLLADPDLAGKVARDESLGIQGEPQGRRPRQPDEPGAYVRVRSESSVCTRRGCCDEDAVLSSLLRLVHSCVGRGDECFEGLALGPHLHDSEARRELDLAFPDMDHGLFHLLA